MVPPTRSIAAALGVALASGLLLGAAADRPAERSFEFTYSATLDGIPKGAGKVALWIPIPKSDDHQEIRDVRIESPFPVRLTVDPRYGNQTAYIEVDDPDVPSFTVDVSYGVTREEYVHRDFANAGRTGDAGDAAVPRDLEANRLVPLNQRIRGLSAEVTAGKTTDLEKARAIYDYVLSTMKYDKSGTGWGHGDILWACDAKRGNCTDFHALFIGLCRAAGIPARFMIGFPLPASRGEGAIPGYHCWAEFHLRGFGWVPVDASEAWKHPDERSYFFGAWDENRVQLSAGRDIVLSPAQAGPPLNYLVYPYAEIDGKPFDGVVKKFTYRDVESAKGGAR